MGNNKTIAIFSGYYVPHLGGVERYTDNLSKELIKRGYNVVIVSSDYDNKQDYKFSMGNLKLYLLPVLKLFVERYPIPKKNSIYRKIIKDLKRESIDIVIVNTRFHLTSLVGAKFGKNNDIPVYLIEHGSQHLTIDNKVLDFFGAHYEHALTRYIARFVDYYYGVSKEAADWLKHFNIRANGVWYNSINDFSDGYIIDKPKDKTVFLYAGRILKQKGLVDLVECFLELRKKYENIELRIAGDGNLLSKLKSSYIDDKLFYLGKLDFNSLCEEYAKANVFVYAPVWPEGLPTSILEAGLLKCACISSPLGGCKEIVVNNETGLIVNSKEELIIAMEKMINNKRLVKELANSISEKVSSEFIWERTADKIIGDIKIK